MSYVRSLFSILAGLVVVASGIAAQMGLEVTHPGTGEIIRPVSLLSVSGLHRILTEMVTNFTDFAPLGTVLVALIAILMYVAMRFEWRFAVGSVIALIHDVLITVGLFALLQIEFDLPVLAAVLAVIGYSLNDTIVVYDRIRENFRKMRKGKPEQIINRSLTETLSRTLVTSLTTILVLLALFFLGGKIIHGFAFALLVGVLIGTYSSIYVASTAILMLGVSKADLMAVKKEDVVDDRP